MELQGIFTLSYLSGITGDCVLRMQKQAKKQGCVEVIFWGICSHCSASVFGSVCRSNYPSIKPMRTKIPLCYWSCWGHLSRYLIGWEAVLLFSGCKTRQELREHLAVLSSLHGAASIRWFLRVSFLLFLFIHVIISTVTIILFKWQIPNQAVFE